eukprot:30925-Pelagococcus_subviridis.AAC.11
MAYSGFVSNAWTSSQPFRNRYDNASPSTDSIPPAVPSALNPSAWTIRGVSRPPFGVADFSGFEATKFTIDLTLRASFGNRA